MCNIKQEISKPNKMKTNIDTGNRLVVTEEEGGGGGNE